MDSIYFVIITFTPIGCGDWPYHPTNKVADRFRRIKQYCFLLLLIEEIRRVRTWHRPDHPEEADAAA